MTRIWAGSRKSFDVPCTVEIEQTSETLHAHVVLDGDIDIVDDRDERCVQRQLGQAGGQLVGSRADQR